MSYLFSNDCLPWLLELIIVSKIASFCLRENLFFLLMWELLEGGQILTKPSWLISIRWKSTSTWHLLWGNTSIFLSFLSFVSFHWWLSIHLFSSFKWRVSSPQTTVEINQNSSQGIRGTRKWIALLSHFNEGIWLWMEVSVYLSFFILRTTLFLTVSSLEFDLSFCSLSPSVTCSFAWCVLSSCTICSSSFLWSKRKVHHPAIDWTNMRVRFSRDISMNIVFKYEIRISLSFSLLQSICHTDFRQEHSLSILHTPSRYENSITCVGERWKNLQGFGSEHSNIGVQTLLFQWLMHWRTNCSVQHVNMFVCYCATLTVVILFSVVS